MKQDTEVFRSAVRTSLVRKLLLRGTVFALLGLSILMYGGIRVASQDLEHWGWIYFVGGLFLITAGLRPYRQLTRLQLDPYTINVSESTATFARAGKRFYSLPLSLIREGRYVDTGSHYGIALSLKSDATQKVCVHDPMFPMDAHLTENRATFNADLFFPYFSPQAFQEFDEHLQASLDEIVHTDQTDE